MSVITFSRQFGAGGKTLAQKVANKLGYKIAHEEIIDQLATEANVSAEGIQAFEVEGEGLIDKSTGMLVQKRFIDHLFNRRQYMDGQQYIRLLEEIIPRFADKGNIIMLGRGAQYILADREDTHHVLLVADQADRNAFIQKHYNLSPADAESVISKQNKRRLKLMKLFHHEDFDSPWHYDLVLNMSKIDIDLAGQLVAGLVSSA